MTISALQFLVLSLAVYRVVRLWLEDTITEPVRSRVIGSSVYLPDGTLPRQGYLLEHPNTVNLWLLDLLTCPWCLGVHVSFWAVLAACASSWVSLSVSWAGAVAFGAVWMAVAAGAALWGALEQVLLGEHPPHPPEVN